MALEGGAAAELVEHPPDARVAVGPVRGAGPGPIAERPHVGEERLELGVDAGVRTARRDPPDDRAEPVEERVSGRDDLGVADLVALGRGGRRPRSGRPRRDLPETNDPVGEEQEAAETFWLMPTRRSRPCRPERGDELVVPLQVIAFGPDPDSRVLLLPDHAQHRDERRELGR